MHSDNIQQIGVVFSKNTSNLQSLVKLLKQNIKYIFQRKKTSPPPQINVLRKVLGFWQENLTSFNINISGYRGKFGM